MLTNANQGRLNTKRWTFLLGICTVPFAVGTASAQQQPSRVCISTRDIVRSEPQSDGTAITFTMRDGSVWRNDLLGRCNDLTFNGFTWDLRNPDQRVC